jgi:RNA polymerase sigma factor (sigma-70 family)
MKDAADLLKRYAETGEEEAFRQIVESHLGIVFSAALRKLNGDRNAAQDVSQVVFSDLARKARFLPRKVVLAGWLYRHTCLKAAEFVRAETRRRAREQTAADMNALYTSDEAAWRDLARVLDDAMQHLSETDRDALILRFFQNGSLRAVGAVLRTSEDAAQKRISRALDKLRTELSRQGVSSTAAALGATLSAHAASDVPGGMPAALATTALASAAAGHSVISLLQTIAIMKAKTLIISALILGAGTALFLQQRQISRLQERLSPASPGSDTPVASVQTQETFAAQPDRAASGITVRSNASAGRPSAVSEILARAKEMISGKVGLQGREYSRLLDTLRQLPPAEIPAALQTVMQLTDADQRRWLSEGLVSVWAEADGRAATDWLLKNLPADAQRRRLPEVLSSWAEQEPAAALAWLREFNANQDYGPNLPSSFRQALFEELTEGMSIGHFDQAVSLWNELTNEGEKSAVFRGLLRHTGSEAGRQRIAEFISQLPDSNAKREAQYLFTTSYAFMDTPGAAKYVEGFANAQERASLAESVGKKWMETEPEAAVSWWLKQATEETRARIMENIAMSWARQHPSMTADWLNQIPTGAERDRAVSVFAMEVANRYPQQALQWAESIADPVRRDDGVVRAFRVWQQADAAAAQQYLNGAGWSPERMAKLKSALEHQRQ